MLALLRLACRIKPHFSKLRQLTEPSTTDKILIAHNVFTEPHFKTIPVRERSRFYAGSHECRFILKRPVIRWLYWDMRQADSTEEAYVKA